MIRKRKGFICAMSLALSGFIGIAAIAGIEYRELGASEILPWTDIDKPDIGNIDFCKDYTVGKWNNDVNDEDLVHGFATKEFAGLYDLNLGIVKETDESLCHRYETVPIYDSWWNNGQDTSYETHIKYSYETFTFTNYVDIPTEIYHSVRIAAGDKQSFKITTTTTDSYSQETTSEKGASSYYDFTYSQSIKIGSKIDLGVIGASAESDSSFTINVGGSTYYSVSKTMTSTTSYSTVYEQTFEMDNSGRKHAVYYQFNQRQKFKVFFTCVYEMQYKVTNWGSGLFGNDQNWSYEPLYYKGLETYFFLIPVENPYFEVSLYKDGSNGLKKYMGEQAHLVTRI